MMVWLSHIPPPTPGAQSCRIKELQTLKTGEEFQGDPIYFSFSDDETKPCKTLVQKITDLTAKLRQLSLPENRADLVSFKVKILLLT